MSEGPKVSLDMKADKDSLELIKAAEDMGVLVNNINNYVVFLSKERQSESNLS
jgi:hypothetical protein